MKRIDPEAHTAPGSHSPQAARRAAAEWISRRDLGFSRRDKAEFEVWLTSAPHHSAALAEAQEVWSAANRSRLEGNGAGLRKEVGRALARRTRQKYARGLAAVALAASLAIILMLSHRSNPTDTPQTTVALCPDRQVLPDGSTVELNSNARIIVDFKSDLRTVRLVRGEALFEVRKDTTRPFIVTAGGVTVRAVGTAFSVRVESDHVGIVVTEGTVEIANWVATTNSGQTGGAASVPLQADAGTRTVVPAAATTMLGTVVTRLTDDEKAAALAWRNRRFEFNGTPLADAVRLFNHDNKLQLSLANADVGALQLTGVFWTNDAEAFARVVESSLALHADRVDEDMIRFRE